MALVGCGSSEPVDTPANTDGPDDVRFETGNFEVPPGDSFTCFYTSTTTAKEFYVVNADGEQAVGGHHIVVYWTDKPRAPTNHPCTDNEMVSWHQIAGAVGTKQQQGAEGFVGLPPGVALKVPAGKQLVMQAHYINTTGASYTADDKVHLITTDPNNVKALANYLVLLDEAFNVPPHAKYSRTTSCKLDRDFKTVLMLGHMHEYGSHYKLEQINETGTNVLYDKDWKPSYASHPPVINYTLEEPYMLKKGETLRQTCSWDNSSPDPLLFPREMCLAFFYYYPDVGEITCDATP